MPMAGCEAEKKELCTSTRFFFKLSPLLPVL